MVFAEQLAEARVLPVITPLDVESSLQLAGALQRGGMSAVEITLRSSAALDSIRAVKASFPTLYVAAGTVTRPQDMTASMEAGADLCISPGIGADLLRFAGDCDIPFLPGVATASEVMLGMSYGLDVFKLFPAVPAGGIAMLKSLAGPFPGISFCPTGGLTPDNFREFLALDNVVCCGGSWMVTETLVAEGRWDDIETLARDAMSP